MSKYCYTFDDWVSNNVPETAPPDALLETLPLPSKLVRYNPAWGKHSKSAEKAVQTRNHNNYLKAKDMFIREVLPHIVDIIDAESLHSIGVDLRLPELVTKSGYQFWRLDERGSWIAPKHPNEAHAVKMGAYVITNEEAFEFLDHHANKRQP